VKPREQIVRIALVLAVVLGAILVLRFVVIPGSTFSTREHRASTIRRVVALPAGFAGQAACADCHSDEAETKNKGFHKGLACETCHGPSAKHAAADDPGTVKPFAPRDRKFCPTCHAYDAARPTGFPQINPESHNPLKPCITCHKPHDPVPPETPHECSACHAQIARTKALSSHALLPCTTCHEASEQHRTQPRSALPTKPQNRDFCGQCHANGAANPDSPKIDLASHGAPYLCWQCHYPHLPEGR
jgi:hypothetical protein